MKANTTYFHKDGETYTAAQAIKKRVIFREGSFMVSQYLNNPVKAFCHGDLHNYNWVQMPFEDLPPLFQMHLLMEG